MYRPIACLVDQHAAWVVPLAGLICWVSLHTALRLNRHSLESGSNTPDFVLARHLTDCLKSYNAAVQHRERLRA